MSPNKYEGQVEVQKRVLLSYKKEVVKYLLVAAAFITGRSYLKVKM
jgi:hypothetical protein